MTLNRRRWFVALLVAVGGVTATGVALGSMFEADSANPVQHSVNLMTGGKAIATSATQRATMTRLGFGRLYLLGIRGDRAFYRVADTSGRQCFAMGLARTLGQVGSVSCPANGSALVDWTYVEVAREDPEPRVWSASGIAADGVTTLDLVG